MTLTVQQIVDAGREMNRVHDKIKKILDTSALSDFHIIAMMDMIVFDLKKRLI